MVFFNPKTVTDEDDEGGNQPHYLHQLEYLNICKYLQQSSPKPSRSNEGFDGGDGRCNDADDHVMHDIDDDDEVENGNVEYLALAAYFQSQVTIAQSFGQTF